jgi:hypothetical protein
MANSVMLLPPPGAQWTVDLADFAATATGRWPGAHIGESREANGYATVWIQTATGADPMLDCALAVEENGDGSFSVRSGSTLPAAAMFAWVREWLGPTNSCVILNTGTGFRLAEVPYGVDTNQLLAIIESVAPR